MTSSENRGMLALGRKLGFELASDPRGDDHEPDA
jgi:hypothetical protein